jgi:7,8-dihydropterin-6-yl-methyl-4-(beta-D-ribofuranosyl)aminobenzene 5'-phosphate synthase
VKRQVPVHVGEGFFKEKFKREGDREKAIGVPMGRGELEGKGARFVESREARQVGPGCFVTGTIESCASWERTEPELCIRTISGELIPDPFVEEMVLAVDTARGLVVFIGCAHRGLLNSIAAARQLFDGSRVRAVFGGAHLRSASNDRIRRSAEAVARLDPERVALGHCTGEGAERVFTEVLGRRFEPLRAGAVFHLD